MTFSWIMKKRNPLMILVLTQDLSFKVICNFEGQTYTNHAISPFTRGATPSFLGLGRIALLSKGGAIFLKVLSFCNISRVATPAGNPHGNFYRR